MNFVNFVLQFVSVRVVAENIKINKNKIIVEIIVFRYTIASTKKNL